MELFLVLIPVTVALVALSLWAFVWSARHEQFDDLDRQAYSILFDEDEDSPPVGAPPGDTGSGKDKAP